MHRKYIVAIPAYGRDYKTEADVLAAWNQNKDFKIQDSDPNLNGRYIGKSEAEQRNLAVQVRFNKLRDVAMLNSPESHEAAMPEE